MHCNVIRDLLPLYVDGCCCEESSKLVEEHLKGCAECRAVFNCMRTPAAEEAVTVPAVKLRRISDWKASVLQSLMLFLSFAIITLGVILEGSTPIGPSNGLWAVALIIPATGYLLSLANWFFIRVYKNRKMFSNCSCIATLAITALGYIWAALHYAGAIAVRSPLVWAGVVFSILLCALSKILSNQYALLLGRE